MKVYISADMEGISGVVGEQHVDGKSPEYREACRWMTDDVNAAIEGAFVGGADEVLVNDGHANGINLLIDRLDPRARLICGFTRALSMVEGVERGFDAAFFVGYHSRKGTPGVMDHTYAGRLVQEACINDRPVGEVGLNAAAAGAYRVPVVLVTGDSVVCAEARELLGEGNVETVAVKRSLGRHAADCLPLGEAGRLIREGAERAVSLAGRAEPYQVESPVTLKVRFTHSSMAQACLLIPKVRRVDEQTVSYTSTEWLEAYKCFRAMLALAK